MTDVPDALATALSDLLAILASPQNSVSIHHEARRQYLATLREAQAALEAHRAAGWRG